MSRRELLLRLGKRVLIGLAILVGMLCSALVWLTQTGSGRTFLLGRVLAQADALLPGRVEVRELARLDTSGLTLRGIRVLDPHEAEVLRLERLEVEIDLRAAIGGRIVIPAVLLAGGSVDLRTIGDPHRGLIAAFVDPSTPKSPPSSTPPPYVRVGRVSVRELDVRAPPAGPLGLIDAKNVTLDASYELDETSAGALDRFEARLERGGAALGRLETLTAKLRRGTAASELALSLALADGPKLGVSAKLVLPPEPSFRTRPLEGRVRLETLTAPAIARLLADPALEGAFSGAISATLELGGTLERLSSKLSLDTAGGPVAIAADLDQLERVQAKIECEKLRIERLRDGLPARRVTLGLSGNADFRDPARIPVHLRLEGSRVDQVALPALKLATVITPTSANELDLTLNDGASEVRARGSIGFTGTADVKLSARVTRSTLETWGRLAGARTRVTGDARADLALALDAEKRLSVSGNVSLRELEGPDLAIRQADVALALSGEATRPTGELNVRVEGARVGGRTISRLKLRANGGPARYRTELEGELDEGSANLELELVRGSDRVELTARGHGLVQRQPWTLSVRPTTVTTAGGFDTEGIALDFSGQSVRARGTVSKRTAAIELETGDIELAKVGAVLRLAEPLAGTARLEAKLVGKFSAPHLDLTLSGRNLAVGERPALDLDLRAALDGENGEADVALTLAAVKKAEQKSPLSLRLDASHHFPRGPDLVRALAAGTLDARLEIERLESGFVARWAKLDTLPAEGAVSGSIQASGTRERPKLGARLEADATVLGAPLKPSLVFDYADGSTELELGVDDARGHWVDLAFLLALTGPAPSLDELLVRMPHAASDETWSFALVAGQRQLDELPGLTRSTIPAAAAASVFVEHAASAEPNGRFRVSVSPAGEIAKLGDTRCKAARTRLELAGELASGSLRSELRALDGQRQLLESFVEAELPLKPVLSGGAPALGRIHGELSARALDIATLPIVCGKARGTLDLAARIEDPLGEHPELSADVNAKGFSLGAPESVDVDLRARATDKLARVDLALVAKQGRSTLSAELPLTRERDRILVDEKTRLEVDAKLERLPIAPFLNPKGAVSYASGAIDGEVHARGALGAPDLKGKLELRNVAFTATDLSQPFHGVAGTFTFTQNRLDIDHFEAHDRDGVLRIDGGARLEAGRKLNVELNVAAKDFPIRQQGEVVATTEIEAKVKARLLPERSDVTIDLGAVDMWIESLDTRTGIPLEPHPDFTIDGHEPPGKAAPETTASTPAADAKRRETSSTGRATPALAKSARPHTTLLELNAHERIWIKRDDFAVKLGATLNTEIVGDQARVKGRVLLQRGYLSLMGKDFEIQKGSSLSFIGSDKPDPVLDISAVHENRRSGKAIRVVITGRGSKPVLTFKVDDQLVNAGEAFQAIYGSQQSNQDPKGADSQAKAFIGGLTAGLLATTARRELGAAAPIIMIEPGSETGSGRVRAGFEFDSLVPDFLKDVITGVYFEGIVSKGSEGETQGGARTEAGVLLEFYFPKNFFTTGQYGPGPTWSMDVGWQL